MIRLLSFLSLWMTLLLLTKQLPISRSFLLPSRTKTTNTIRDIHNNTNKNIFGHFGKKTTVFSKRATGTTVSMGSATTTATHPENTKDDDDTRKFSLSNRIVHTLDPCVVKTKEWIGNYSHLWEGENGGIVSLAQGVVYWKPPPSCRTALVDAVMSDDGNDETDDESDALALHSYSPAGGLPELVTALETKIEVEHDMSDHDVTVTVGANQAYTNIVLTLLGSTSNNNKAVVFAPYYFNHVMAIQMCAGPEAVVVGPTDMTTGLPDIDWLRQTLAENHGTDDDDTHNTIRMVTLVNPGNPTGIALSKDTVKEIVDLCKDYGVWVVLDCTYEHFFNTGDSDNSKEGAPNPLPTFPNDTHVIHVFSFSKGYAMAGYRCGYLVSHKKDASGEFLSQMLKVQDTIPIGPPRLSQHVALGALKQGSKANNEEEGLLYSPSSKEWVYRKYATLDASRDYILEALSSLPQQIGGSGSMYVMGKLPDDLTIGNETDDTDDTEPIDVTVCRRLVREYGVAIIPGSFCGSPGWIRVCYANLPPERTKAAAERLRRGLRDLTSNTRTSKE